jgi:hypothetical protein
LASYGRTIDDEGVGKYIETIGYDLIDIVPQNLPGERYKQHCDLISLLTFKKIKNSRLKILKIDGVLAPNTGLQCYR